MSRRIATATILILACGVPYLPAQSVPLLSLIFEGNDSVDSARLKAQLRLSRDGGWYHPEALKMELRNLETYYQNEGFLRVKIGTPLVEFRAVPSRGRSAVVRVPILEGPRYTVGQLIVKNAQSFKPATLLQMSPLRSGQSYSRSKIEAWREKIEEAYHAMGHIRIESTIREEIHEFRRVVDCILECKEGNAYRVGKITLVGDESINRSEFKKQLLLGEGSLYNPEMLSLSVQFLNSLRIYRPITESDVEIRIDDARNLVDLIFHITSQRRSPSSFNQASRRSGIWKPGISSQTSDPPTCWSEL